MCLKKYNRTRIPNGETVSTALAHGGDATEQKLKHRRNSKDIGLFKSCTPG